MLSFTVYIFSYFLLSLLLTILLTPFFTCYPLAFTSFLLLPPASFATFTFPSVVCNFFFYFTFFPASFTLPPFFLFKFNFLPFPLSLVLICFPSFYIPFILYSMTCYSSYSLTIFSPLILYSPSFFPLFYPSLLLLLFSLGHYILFHFLFSFSLKLHFLSIILLSSFHYLQLS